MNIIYRFSHICYKNKLPFIGKVFAKINRVIYACDIHGNAEIDKSVTFAHNGLGVVIGHDAIIKENVKILQNVTIGGRGGRKSENGRSNPLIQKGVIIGAGACILGPITIGEYAQVGANAVVINNVPPYAIAVGVPARIIDRRSELKHSNPKERIYED